LKNTLFGSSAMIPRLAGVASWSPADAAEYEVLLSRGLALSDEKTRRVHYRRLAVRESARQPKVAQKEEHGASGAADRIDASGAEDEPASMDAEPTTAHATKKSRRKSAAQLRKSEEKQEQKWLARRTATAHAVAARLGCRPHILRLVLGAVGRFLELLTGEGALMMKRLKGNPRECPASSWRAAHGLPTPTPMVASTLPKPALAAQAPQPPEAPSAAPAPASAPASVDRMRLPASLAKAVVADGAQAVKSLVSKPDKEMPPLPISGEKRGKLPSPSQSPGSSQLAPPQQGSWRLVEVTGVVRKLRKVPPAQGQG